MEQDSTVAAATAKAPRRVPKFDTGPYRPTMNRLQKSFYRRTFLPSLLAGDPVDVQAQWGYALVLLYDLIEERRTNPTEARLTLESLVSAYRGSYLPLSVQTALADFYFLEGDFASGYAALGVWISPSHHLSLSAQTCLTSLGLLAAMSQVVRRIHVIWPILLVASRYGEPPSVGQTDIAEEISQDARACLPGLLGSLWRRDVPDCWHVRQLLPHDHSRSLRCRRGPTSGWNGTKGS